MASELRTRTAVGAAKPFGRPPILRLVQVVLAAYIGAGGGLSKMGGKSPDCRRGDVPGYPAVPPDADQTPIRSEMHLINSSDVALDATAVQRVPESYYFCALL